MLLFKKKQELFSFNHAILGTGKNQKERRKSRTNKIAQWENRTWI